jgi:hypothetical protein
VPPAGVGALQVGGPVGELDLVPPSYSGRQTGGARLGSSVSWSQMWLEAVGPVNSAPSDPATRLASDVAASQPRNAAPAPKEPRLSANTSSLGRFSAGSATSARGRVATVRVLE